MLIRYLTLLTLMVVPFGGQAAAVKTYKAALDADSVPYEFEAIDGNIGRIFSELRAETGRSGKILPSWLLEPSSWLAQHGQEALAAVVLLTLLLAGFVLWSVQSRRRGSIRTQRLLENQTYLRTLYDKTPVGLALCDMDGSLVDINQTYADILGYSMQETLKLTYWDITPEEYAEEEQRQLQTLKTKGSYGPYEKEYLHKDGHRVPVRLNGLVLERGNKRYIWSTVEDIRLEKAQQVCLEEQAEEMHAVIESSPDGILVVGTDNRIRRINPAVCSIFGYSLDEMVEMSIDDLIPQELRQGQVANFLEDVSATSHLHGDRTREVLGRHKRGRLFPCAITLSRFTLLQKPLFSVRVQDLSKQKQAEQESLRLASILEATTDVVGIFDVDFRTIFVNQAGRKMLGFGEFEELSELHAVDYHTPEAAKRFVSEVLPALDREPTWRWQTTFLSRLGREIIVDQTLVVHRNEKGEINHYSTISRDITDRILAEHERAEMQTQTEHAQRLESLGVLAGGIAHDFNNILTAILGNAAMAERYLSTNPQGTQKYLGNIVESSERAAELCKQMLAYSGRGKFVVKAVDLSQMVEAIARLIEVSIPKNVVLKYRLATNLPSVNADAAQMQQVIMNLVINASDAIGAAKGVISISTEEVEIENSNPASNDPDDPLPAGRYLCLRVLDDGCGMDKMTQARIFEPFFSTKFTGHGLGMSAVLGIVRGHQGTIRVSSVLGQGTSFKVLLPISDQQSVSTVGQAPVSAAWKGAGTVLVVDDEAAIRDTATMMLENLGFKTRTAINGVDGLAVYRDYQAEIVAVLLDMTMPIMGGEECCAGLLLINPEVRIILSSGYSAQDAIEFSTVQGLFGFLPKPYNLEVLQDMMEKIAASSAGQKG